jgi:hypothetical protein
MVRLLRKVERGRIKTSQGLRFCIYSHFRENRTRILAPPARTGDADKTEFRG